MTSDELRDRLMAMSTRELVDILRERDAEEWRPEVFPLVEAILQDRGVDAAALQAGAAGPSEVPRFEALESVASLGDSFRANLCRMALREAGIEAWLSNEHLAGVAPPLGLAIGIDVLVRPGNAASAREVLSDVERGAASIPEEPEACPGCGSSDTEHLRAPDRLSAISGWALTSTPLPTGIWRWRCKQCGHEWE